MFDAELCARFQRAVADLTAEVGAAGINIADDDVDAEVRRWLDGPDSALAWAGPGITPDEWLFITTLYGTMTLDGQRTHIQKFFPLFVRQVNRDIRNFTPALLAEWRLRQPWMKTRLCRMAEVLLERGQTCGEYVDTLRDLESRATLENPMPAFRQIMRDHRAGEGKTLSVFIRDCVKGNCFPIDSRVASQLERYGLPKDEQGLVGLCLDFGLNPRRIARIFYQAPG
ncbi:MAG: hypothetical protein HY000_28870 [Planctomycetes bacterium]|nr:hypothetical protein [Planctomycetota bacterium]